jgi:hypothetical protein
MVFVVATKAAQRRTPARGWHASKAMNCQQVRCQPKARLAIVSGDRDGVSLSTWDQGGGTVRPLA